MTISAVAAAWTDTGITWNNQPGVISGTDTVIPNADNGSPVWDITNTLQNYYSGSSQFNGIVLRHLITGAYGLYTYLKSTDSGSPATLTITFNPPAPQTGYTDTNGFYSITAPATGSFTATASAFGYDTQSVPITISGTMEQDFSLPIHNTYDHQVYYDLNNEYTSVASNAHIAYSYQTDSNSLTIVGVGSELLAPKSTPSGASNMVRLYGHDASALNTGYAYTYFYLTGVNLPISAPMDLAFNVVVVSSPWCNGHISVDAHFTDGSVLRDLKDNTGSYILDGSQTRIHPALQHLPGCAVPWTRVVADLTEVKGKTIDYLMVAYDNGHTGGEGSANPSIFQAYFDDIRLERPSFPVNTINGGFENGLYGWASSGNKSPELASVAAPGEGSHSALLGRNPSVDGTSASTEDSGLAQVFRIPNDGTFQSPTLTFWAKLGTQESCLCTTGDYVQVYFNDRTTGQNVIELLATTNSAAWTFYSFDVSSLEGHIVWLTLTVHQDSDGLATWAYFDGVRIVPGGTSVSESSNSQAILNLDAGTFRPTSTGSIKLLAMSFSDYGTDSSVNGGIQVGLDLHSFVHDIAQSQDIPDFSATVTGWINGGGQYYIRDSTLIITITTLSGDTNAGVNYGKTYGFNLGASNGYPRIDPISLGLTEADIALTSLDVMTFAVPGVDAVVTGASVVLTVVGLAYTVYQSTTPSQSNTYTATASWACPCFAGSGVSKGGGTGAVNPWLGINGGTYQISITGKAGVYTAQCNQNVCLDSHVTDLSTTYSLTITDTNTLQNFAMAPGQNPSMVAGSQGSSTISLTGQGGFTNNVGLTDAVPSGLNCLPLNPASVTLTPSTTTAASTLSCSSSTPGTYTVTVSGTSGSMTRAVAVTFTVTPPPDFTLSGPSTVSVTEGYYSRIPITGTELSSDVGPITITFSGSAPQPYQPSGSITTGPLGISFSPASLVLNPGQSANVLMTLSDAGAPAGVTYYPLYVTGTTGSVSHTLVMNATVTGYSISSEGGYQCTIPNYILCLSAAQNGIPGDPVDLFASGITGTVTYTTSISACVSGCNGGTPPIVYWLDTGTSSSNITITSTSCSLRNIYSTSNTASFCGNKELIIHAYSGIGNYNITVGATCVSGFCVNYGFGPKTYTFYILFNVYASGGGGGSVSAGTLITLADGSQVPVQDLHIGEQLLSYDLTSGQYVVTNITRLATVETYNQMVISTGNGKPLIVDQNPAQKLYVRLQDGAVTLMSVTDLRVGYDLFYATSQTWVPITSIHYENRGTHLMYDIYTTSPGNYIANGYLDPLKT